ncbi:MAG: carboxypeptidase-like regulatory domain-containing protein [Flavobacteriaceae bacterium]|nr:carboxypeptidase-like regulatory domain-containing protein [Flavobacteriaceae bacterium]
MILIFKHNFFKALIMFFYCYSGFAQIVQGNIIDLNNEPIPFATIQLKNSNRSVASNENGKFGIYIPEDILTPELIISALGYSNVEIKVIKKTKKIEVKLSPSIIELSEVVVTNRKKLTANDIVRNAFLNYTLNFPNAPFVSKGFIRHTERTKSKYKYLVEAAVEKYDPGFQFNNDFIKSHVVSIKNNIDNRILDTLILYKRYLHEKKNISSRKAWHKTTSLNGVPMSEKIKAIRYHDRHLTLNYKNLRAPFLLTLFGHLDIIRDYGHNKKSSFRLRRIFKNYEFTIKEIVSYEGVPYYRIKFQSTKHFAKDRSVLGWILINKKNYKIKEIKRIKLDTGKFAALSMLNSGTKLIYIQNIKYKDIHGKMYPYYISFKVPKQNRSALRINKVEEDQLYYYSHEEVLFTNFTTDESKIKESKQKVWDDKLFKPFVYNPKFWSNYDILLESEYEKQMRKDLESDIMKRKKTYPK